MSTLIDFRNGRYQGQVKNKKPNGVGIYFGADLTFAIAHWQDGKLAGKAIIIYPDATIFCGQIRNGLPQGICYYELQRQKIKVYFSGGAGSPNKFAVSVPNFVTILQIDRSSLNIIAKFPFSRSDSRSNQVEIEKIIGKSMEGSTNKEYENFLYYFEENFSVPYADLFEQLIVSVNGSVQYWMGYRLQGLGVKIQPLALEEQGGRTYKICEMGVMTKENVLCGIGVRITNTILKKLQVEEGIFALTHTLTTYQYHQNQEKTRPTKCLITFINYLKRSMTFHDQFLYLNQPETLKKEIDKISEVTFTEMKVKNAHEIIETPLSNSEVLADIEKKRRKKQEQSSKYQLGRYKSNLEPNIYNTGQIHPASSSFNLNTLKQDLERSISKKKSNKSFIGETSIKETPIKSNPSYNSPSKSNQKRYTGIITPKKSKPSEEKRVGVLTTKSRKNSRNISPTRYNSDNIYEKDENAEVLREEPKKIPSPILKQSPDQQRGKRKVSYKQKQLDQWERSKLKFSKTNTSPKKYSDLHRNTKASSPVKPYQRRILTQNIFQT